MSKSSEPTRTPATRIKRPTAPLALRIDGWPISLDSLVGALDRPLHVELSEAIWQQVERGHALLNARLAANDLAYGINTGFGYLCHERIPRESIDLLQRNLIETHAVGVGPPTPDAIVRLMMFLKILALSKGVSGISRPTLDCLVQLLNADVLPVIPCQGSLGASGDLAPLSHMALAMLGQGTATVGGRERDSLSALTEFRIKPITLGPKEGLALNNGTQFMSAYGVLLALRTRHLIKHADLVASMTVESLRACLDPFDARLHELRPHPGAIACAKNIRSLTTDSEILPKRSDNAPVQDPYSLRCIPQVHGASRDAVTHVTHVIETEINAVSDNPILFENGDVVSGGLFHGQPLALALDYLAIAQAELASISERRINLLLSGRASLPKFLIEDTGVNSGFMVPHYTAAALTSENKGLCMPASVDSIPTSLGQEDHVSMGARSAVKCLEVLENTETVLAIEQLCAAQALDLHAPLKPAPATAAAHSTLRKHISYAESDRPFGVDIQTSLRMLRSREMVTAAETATGPLA